MQHQAVDLLAARQLHPLPLHHLDRDRILLFPEISLEDVLLSYFQRRDTHEIEESRIVERIGRARLDLIAAPLPEEAGVRIDLEISVNRLVVLHEVLHEAPGVEVMSADPRLENVVQGIENGPALQPEPEAEGLRTANRVERRHL